MSEIKTALERFQAYCASKGIPEKSSLAHIHKMDQFEEHERKELRAAYESLQKEKTKIEDELDEYKEHHEELTEHYRALQFLESEFRKENESLNAEVFRLKNELITSLKDWHDLNANNAALQKENAELKHINLTSLADLHFKNRELEDKNAAQEKRIAELEAATEHLGLTPQQAADGLARYKAQVAEIESLRKQVEEFKEKASFACSALAHASNNDPLYKKAYLGLRDVLFPDLKLISAASKNGE